MQQWDQVRRSYEADFFGVPEYSADDELKLAKLRVPGSQGRRLYGGCGVGQLLGGEGRVATAGELADAGLSRMAGAGAFPSPIAHAARLEQPGAARLDSERGVASSVLRCVYEALAPRFAMR